MKPARKQKLLPDESRKVRVIRPELNLEQWSLWQPTNARGELKAKVLERVISLPDGTQATARVLVDFTSFGALTTEDQKTLYGLVKIWEDKGESITYTYISISQLLKTLRKTRGPNTVAAVVKSLRRLRRNPIDWQLSYVDGETGERVTTFEDPFTILSELKIINREKNGKPVREEGYFRFHPLILKNLKANHRRPVLFDVVLSLKGDIAQILYTLIDRTLSEALFFERRTVGLFQELGIEGKEYQKQAARKRTVERALKELEGKPLSAGGFIVSARTMLTEDKKDYKVVVEKGNLGKETPPPANDIPQEDSDLVKRLNQEFGISFDKAREIERTKPKEALEWLGAKTHVSDWKRKTAGFWVEAITKPSKIELPLSFRGAKEKVTKAERETRKQDLEKAKRRHEERFGETYARYFENRVAEVQRDYASEWRAFEAATSEERRKNERLLSKGSKIAKAIFQTMVCDFFREHPKCPVLNFWDWDQGLNPESFDGKIAQHG